VAFEAQACKPGWGWERDMGDFQVWERGSFKTRNGYREVGKELKQGLVETKGWIGARQASNGKK